MSPKKFTDSLCYWCGEKTTSREHVPPICLFPEDKDMKGFYNISFRKNLITVPSCDAHNSDKSNDDEYLMACLALKVGNNGVSYIHAAKKVTRAFSHNPNILSGLSPNSEPKSLRLGTIEFPVHIVDVDKKRLMRSFEGIARGLYYHEYYPHRAPNDIVIVSDIFYPPHPNANAVKIFQRERTIWDTEVKGDNPKIFTYQFSHIDKFGSQSIAMRFYESIYVYVGFIKKVLNNMNA